jgi:hypothetical protein
MADRERRTSVRTKRFRNDGDLSNSFRRHVSDITRLGVEMKSFIAVLSILAMCQQVQAKCDPRSTDVKADLHWSDSSVTEGPDCSASIEVRADPKGDAAAKVYLHRAGSPDVQLPFNVFRDGTLYWQRSGKRIAYQDAYSYGVYRLWLVDIGSKAAEPPRTMLSEEALRKAVESSLGRNQSIARFWPDLAEWQTDSVLVTVRIQTLNGSSGPLTEHCLGFLISMARETQITPVSEANLKKEYKASCQHNEK